MKIGGYRLWAVLAVLCFTTFVIAEEGTCTADGDCSVEDKAAATEAATNASGAKEGCDNKHDQCEFWASIGE